MDVRLPSDLNRQVAQEIASGRYSSSEQLIEEAVRRFFDDRQREERRLATLRRLAQAVDDAGLYERAFTPPE
jgi:Arc/MetJ-type ribon-helix-helix transcriptional regulator